MKILYSLLVLLFLTSPVLSQIEKSGDLIFEGIVSDLVETKIWSDFEIGVIAKSGADSLIATVSRTLVDKLDEQSIPGKQVKVTYNVISDKVVYAMELKPPSKVNTLDQESKSFSVMGRLNTCTCGDFGGYIDISLPNGDNLTFTNEFVDPVDLYRGDDVIVYYAIRKEIKVISIEVLHLNN